MDSQARQAIIEKLREASPLIYKDDSVIHVPAHRKFAAMAGRSNFEMLCNPATKVMADHLSIEDPVLRYVYVVHGVIKGFHLPLVVFLLLDKEEETYKELWRYLIHRIMYEGLSFAPRAVRLDVEPEGVARRAFASVLPQCTIYVSLEQVLRSWYKRLREYMTDDLRRQHNDGLTHTGMWLRGVFGLPYLTATRVKEGYDLLLERMPVDARAVRPFFDYVYETFIGPDAKYPLSEWAFGQLRDANFEVDVRAFVPPFEQYVTERTQQAFLDGALHMQNVMWTSLQRVEDPMQLGPFRLEDPQKGSAKHLARTAWKLYIDNRMSFLDFVQLMGNKVAPRD